MLFKKIKFLILILIFISNTLFASELKKVSLQLSWFDQFQFAGYYMAKEKGFYKKAGLDVELKPYNLDMDISKEINEGRADFAIDRETLLLERLKYKNIVVLYALFQSSPLVLLSTKESKINNIDDFVGKRLMSTIRDAGEVSIKAMINSNNISLNDLELLDHSHNIQDLVDKKTDIISAYISRTPFNLQNMGVEYNVFAPKDYDFDMYSDFLFTSASFITKDKKTVEAFKKASLKGWDYAFSHIDESVNLIIKKYHSQNDSREALVYEANELKKLAYLNTNTLGKIDKNKIKRIYDLYKILGYVDGKVDYDKFIYDSKTYKIPFSKQEKEYLKQKKNIKMCIDPNWMPFEGLDDMGNHIGLNKDFIQIFKDELSIPINIVKTSSWSQSLQFAKEKKCDLLSLATPSQSRKKYFNFTSSYLNLPVVLVTKLDVPFTTDFSSLDGKKIGIPKDYVQIEIIKEKYPKIEIVEVENINDGLEKVLNGKIFGYIGNLVSIGYSLQDRFIGQLKISAKFPYSSNLGMGIRNDDIMLYNIFEKMINNISQQTKENIFSKNIAVKYDKEVDYTLVINIVLVSLFIAFIFLYRQYILKKLNKDLNEKVNEKTKELQELNESLEEKVKVRTIKLEQSKELLREMAFKDNLTKAFNRHYLFEIFEKITLKKDEPISLLILDIDFFKNINDKYGHIIGDEILRFLVKKINIMLKKQDVLTRFGGEEFVILLPNTSLEEAILVSEKIREFIQKNVYIKDTTTISLTVSIGVSQYKEDEMLECLINRADGALYSAKKNGRNQVQSQKTED